MEKIVPSTSQKNTTFKREKSYQKDVGKDHGLKKQIGDLQKQVELLKIKSQEAEELRKKREAEKLSCREKKLS